MIYKILIGKNEVKIDEEDKQKIVNNIDKNFIILKSGEVLNPSFVQGIFIDHESSIQERKYLPQAEVKRVTKSPEAIKELLDKYKPGFLKDENR